MITSCEGDSVKSTVQTDFEKTFYFYTGRFIMFSVIANTYNKKTKGATLMELFTATEKLEKFLLTTRDVRCVHHG